MKEKQDWINAYNELSEEIQDEETGITEIKHVDLWHEQIDFMQDEYPWPSSSLFLEFEVVDIEDNGNKVQDMNTIIHAYYCFQTLADTYSKSETKADSLAFGDHLRKIHKFLQGRTGENYGRLSRMGFRRIPAPQYLIVYRQSYRCIIRDESAMDEPEDRLVKTAKVTKGEKPPVDNGVKLYEVPL